MRIQDVVALIEAYAPAETGIPGDELGLLLGDPSVDVTGVVTCWAPTLSVLQKAAEIGANLVIGHEPLTYGRCGRDPEAHLQWYEERHPTAKVPNQRRLAFALSKGLSIYRYHSNWDWAPQYGMVDRLAAALGLGTPVGGERGAPIHVIPAIVARELAERARRRLGAGPLRLIGDPERVVTRVALCHGGFGQMFTYPEVPVRHGAELAFFGEMLDYTIRYCVEVDLIAVELGHYRSENLGMEGMAAFLRERLPSEIPVHCLPSGEPWVYVGA